MKFKQVFQSKKYLIRIFLWITFITLVVVSSFSGLIYFNVEKNVFKSEYENSQKVLIQMKYNIDYLDTVIRNLTSSTYSNNDVKALMYLNGEETFDTMKIISSLNNTIVLNNSFIQSIYIYNNNKKVYYSTSEGFIRKDVDLEQALSAYKVIPTLKAIVRKMGEQTVLSYVMYENMDNENHMDGAVILNINLDWLLNNIQTINQVNESTHSQLYIMDSHNQFIEMDRSHPIAQLPIVAQLRDAYESSVQGSAAINQESFGFFTKRLAGEKQVVSYIHLDNTGWTLLETKPYNEAYANLRQLLDTILFLTAAILIVALLLTLSVSRGIYRPVKRLMEQTSSLGGGQEDVLRTGKQDEFSFLTEVYQKSKERLHQYNLEKNNNIAIMKLYFLKKLLLNSYSLSTQEFEELLKELNPAFSKDKPFILCVLRIDQYKHFLKSKSLAERELLRFAITNVTTELISEAFVVQTIDMKDDSFTILVNTELEQNGEEKLQLLFKEAQSYIQQYYHISFTAAVSRRITEYTTITAAYNHTFDNSHYRYVFGKMSIITDSLLNEPPNKADIEQVLEIESKCMDLLRRGELAKAEEKFEDLFVNIRKLEYSDIMLVNMQVLHHFKR